jgi:hypothetical protein
MHRFVLPLLILTALLVVAPARAERTEVQGRWYEESDTEWYVLDSHGERWEIALGSVEHEQQDHSRSTGVVRPRR